MTGKKAFLAGCACMIAVQAGITVLAGAKAPAVARFDEITVGRINIEEPDGTKRMVISNRAQFPGEFDHGKEKPRPDRNSFAGMLFINEEGTENGGLIQKGAEGKEAGLSLTFDRFNQDQALQLLHAEGKRGVQTSIRINDVPAPSVATNADMDRFVKEADSLPENKRDAYWQKLADEGKLMQNRIYLGMSRDNASSLILNDAKGRPRMMLLVGAKGQPEIRMLDDDGKVVRSVKPDAP